MTTGSISYRSQLSGVLETLSSGSSQIEYQTSVPIAYVPHEIISQFFDDFYHPKSSDFLNAFTEEELKQIGIFSGYLDIASQIIDEANRPDISDLLKHPDWRKMMSKAACLLEIINKNG